MYCTYLYNVTKCFTQKSMAKWRIDSNNANAFYEWYKDLVQPFWKRWISGATINTMEWQEVIESNCSSFWMDFNLTNNWKQLQVSWEKSVAVVSGKICACIMFSHTTKQCITHIIIPSLYFDYCLCLDVHHTYYYSARLLLFALYCTHH